MEHVALVVNFLVAHKEAIDGLFVVGLFALIMAGN